LIAHHTTQQRYTSGSFRMSIMKINSHMARTTEVYDTRF